MSLKTNAEILGGLTLWPDQSDLRQLCRRSSPIRAGTGLCQLDHLRDAEHGDQPHRRPAGGLRLQPLQLPGRQASVLLAADQPDGAARGFRAAVLPALFGRSVCSTPISRWRWRITLFNVPLAVWILEGFMRGVPKEIDETAYIDGYSFPRSS
jgi:hypothetical protein